MEGKEKMREQGTAAWEGEGEWRGGRKESAVEER